MPFDLLKLRYCNLFCNAITTNEGMPPISTILRQKLGAMATSLEDSQSDIRLSSTSYMPMVKIGPLDLGIRGLEVDY